MKSPPNNTALQTFMRSLLLDHSSTPGNGEGDFILVVDNASSSVAGKPYLPDHRPRSDLLPTITGYDSGYNNNINNSNHSANRWLTDEKFPTRETMKRVHTSITTRTARSPTTIAMDSLFTSVTTTNLVPKVDAPSTPIRGNNKRTNSDQNLGPTFPVRKLSPQAHREDESGTVSPSSVFHIYEGQPQDQPKHRREARMAYSTARPPLSPRKNSLAARQPQEDPSASSTTEKPTEAKKNKSFGHPPSLRTSNRSPLQQNNNSQKPILPSLWIVSQEEHDDEDSSSCSAYLHDSFDSSSTVDRVTMTTPSPPSSPGQGLIRGLSAVLGANIPISPPVAPIRRESAQVYPDNDDYNSSSQSFLDHDEEDASSLDQDGMFKAMYQVFGHEKQLLDQSSPKLHRYSSSSISSMITSAATLNERNYLDVYYTSTMIPTGSASSNSHPKKNRGPDTDEDIPPSLQPPMRSK